MDIVAAAVDIAVVDTEAMKETAVVEDIAGNFVAGTALSQTGPFVATD